MNWDEVHRFEIDVDEIIFRRFKSNDSISEITKLLRRSYKQLADLGLRYLATHQDNDETERRLKKGISYIALCKKKIIATISLYYVKSEISNAKWYERDDVAHFGQFAVDPNYQRKGIGSLIMDKLEAKAKELGASEISLDTAENANHLIKYYERRGYRFIEYVNWNVTNYRSIIMSKKLL